MKNFPNLKKPSHLLATFFGIGLMPLAPGTWASLVTLLLFFIFIFFQLSIVFFLIILICLIFLSIISCELASKNLEEKDHKAIVIDEVAGAWLSFTFIAILGLYDFSLAQWEEGSYLTAILLVALFRFFDILKPHPISFIDRKFKSGTGIVLDDLLAGIFAGLTLLGGNFFINFL